VPAREPVPAQGSKAWQRGTLGLTVGVTAGLWGEVGTGWDMAGAAF